MIERVSPFSEPEVVKNIVTAYRRAFGGAPWNEGFICPVCGDTFPLVPDDGLSGTGELCPSCASKGSSVLLVEYWPTSKVMSDFYREMRKPDALCLVAKIGEEIVGFIWGYRIIIDDGIDDYLESPGLSRLIGGEYFYLDDAAVVPEHQGRGIGKDLVRQIIQIQSKKNILGRTLNQSRMFHILMKLHGKVVLHITRNRVIMAVSL